MTATTSSQLKSTKEQEDWMEAQGPFEGPEKLLELWFAEGPEELFCTSTSSHPAKAQTQGQGQLRRLGLKGVPREQWEEMLDIVKCKVLSVIESDEVDAYLLSESSMFVFPHKLILKTCGTTTLLLGLERLLEIAFSALSPLLPHLTTKLPRPKSASRSEESTGDPSLQRALGSLVSRCFYSRKSFMFPERQKGPHRDWMTEVATLDAFFTNGSAYTVGKMNGDHWLLYMAADQAQGEAGARLRLRPPPPVALTQGMQQGHAKQAVQDQTLEILMTSLSPASCARYYFADDSSAASGGDAADVAGLETSTQTTTTSKGQRLGVALASQLGLTNLFAETHVDAFAFEPCGFSANAVVLNPNSSNISGNGAEGRMDGYWTIHITPEEGSSYASFETNVVPTTSSTSGALTNAAADERPQDLTSLINHVISTFEPGKMSITLFVSNEMHAEREVGEADAEERTADAAAAAWQGNSSVLHKLQIKGYQRTDRIAYEFERYDLVFVSFEKVVG
ncbi:S-adenosylmethionine decarboxylase [Tilletiaria anomala UBC 951]|uniref:S-adenosylmethionine decarboxylase n=1 Tax=Tilletiaria anomala (strain ATCC 24038 / CBS 436.72 / UBC 951) TaxID=1037660 RepID=A0A066VX37_TILAU|nr:S-adenosylmethionine decarboxylase [Tilletiaria anomala UBC 951]KDN46292.1 S-adenosylmethionine decarboxylase [Tilletiaria anomala UBC 951]